MGEKLTTASLLFALYSRSACSRAVSKNISLKEGMDAVKKVFLMYLK